MYVISKFDHSHLCDCYISRNGVDHTLHADKANVWSDFETARQALLSWFWDDGKGTYSIKSFRDVCKEQGRLDLMTGGGE